MWCYPQLHIFMHFHKSLKRLTVLEIGKKPSMKARRPMQLPFWNHHTTIKYNGFSLSETSWEPAKNDSRSRVLKVSQDKVILLIRVESQEEPNVKHNESLQMFEFQDDRPVLCKDQISTKPCNYRASDWSFKHHINRDHTSRIYSVNIAIWIAQVTKKHCLKNQNFKYPYF